MDKQPDTVSLATRVPHAEKQLLRVIAAEQNTTLCGLLRDKVRELIWDRLEEVPGR